MGDGFSLFDAFVLLAAAVVTVPIAKRLGLGSVLGYLIAGALIGPAGLAFIDDPEAVMHAAEFGVVIMLFLIGLELQPQLLWRLRTAILGMGAGQILLTAALGAGAGLLLGLDWRMALAAALTLALSSTAIVLQSLRERGAAQTESGRGIFAVLLFQDIAVIPMLALFPLLAAAGAHHGGEAGHGAAGGLIATLPAWAQAGAVVGAVGAIVLAGRVALRPLFRVVAKTNLRELFTALALLLVVGVALLMQLVGLSPALGAFVAGVVLADSEFRHEIESDIEPFRGLLLGLFFLSVGAGIDFALFLADPLAILGLTGLIIAIKVFAMTAVALAFRRRLPEALLTGLALAQGGEFAFVLFAFAEANGVLTAAVVDPLIVAVALSMAATPLLLIAGFWIVGRSGARAGGPARAPEVENDHPQAIVAGFGRFGQIVGRLLQSAGIRTSVIDHDADQVELLRGFGRRVNYGDATRLDLLRAAGAEDARLLVIAIDDRDKALELAETARRHFPNLKVLARAYDRRHAYELMHRHVDAVERETFEAGVRAGVKALRLLGAPAHQSERAGRLFRRYDERLLTEMAAHWGEDFAAYQRAVRARSALEEELLQRDLAASLAGAQNDAAWDAKSLDTESAARATLER
jgi:monovalent cation:proton antiporter-2 (CPA2) family protein